MENTDNGHRRSAGILLHPTSLPGPYGVGDFGPEAFRFVDFLAAARQGLWQVLPLNSPGSAFSPYDGISSFAGNTLLISPDVLVADGLLEPDEVEATRVVSAPQADFPGAVRRKLPLLWQAFRRFQALGDGALRAEFEQFQREAATWLDDYALFRALHDDHDGRPWPTWEPGLVHRDPATLARWSERLSEQIAFHRFTQFLFTRQWQALRGYANARGIRVIGDVPIYVALDSADVWANQRIFTLDDDGHPTVVAGVPPDLFSATGQLWGTPCYRWDVLAAEGYRFWVERTRRALELADIIRIDHFRAFQAGWQVPSDATTAIHGSWVPGPGARIFDVLRRELGTIPVIVEDLGVITPDVVALRESLGYPGMKVLQFAFGEGPDNPYLPHNYHHDSVVYTGTHDNDTTCGWFAACAPDAREHLLRYLGTSGDDVVWDLIRLAMMSVADLAVIPLQDVLGLGSEARMNRPGTARGNWGWRFGPEDLRPELAERLAGLTATYGRVAVS